MEFTMKPYIVYVKIDNMNRIIDINSSAFISDIEGWIEIDQGYGYNFHHAQNNYFNKCIIDERGIYRYKFDNGNIAERTQEEIDADYVEPIYEPNDKERITALEEQNAILMEQNDMLTACVLEISEILYA